MKWFSPVQHIQPFEPVQLVQQVEHLLSRFGYTFRDAEKEARARVAGLAGDADAADHVLAVADHIAAWQRRYHGIVPVGWPPVALLGLAACGGPSKAGLEAREAAYSRIDLINTQIGYSQAQQA